MSIFLKPGMVKVRQEDDEFSEINILAESSSQAYLDAIQAKGEEVLESIPSEYGDLVEEVNGKLDSPQTAGTSGQVLTSDGQGGQSWETPGECTVTDVQVGGTSVLNDGVANIPIASSSALGAVKISSAYGTNTLPEGILRIEQATSPQVKAGTQGYKPIVPERQHESTFYGLAKAAGDTTQSQSNNSVGTYTDEAKSAIQNMLNVPDKSDITVEDVQINGTSIINDGIANIPFASVDNVGVVRISGDYGIGTLTSTGSRIAIVRATDAQIKSGDQSYKPIVPTNQHLSTFYGLAKIAGVDMASSDNPVGTYTEEAKSAIQQMIGIEEASVIIENISGTVPEITGIANHRYMCGEVTTISITPPASGIIDVVFTSGTTAAVLTLPSTVKMPEWFDATELETERIYEINITDGVYGAVMSWPV